MIVGVGGAASGAVRFHDQRRRPTEALRFGIASDMGRRGLVIQEGLGFSGAAIVDQKLAASRPARLPRRRPAGKAFVSGSDCLRTVVIKTTTTEAHRDRRSRRGPGRNRSAQDRACGDSFIAPDTKLCFAGPGTSSIWRPGPSPAVAGNRVGRRTGYAGGRTETTVSAMPGR